MLESASDGNSVCVGNTASLASEVACDKLANPRDMVEVLSVEAGTDELE